MRFKIERLDDIEFNDDTIVVKIIASIGNFTEEDSKTTVFESINDPYHLLDGIEAALNALMMSAWDAQNKTYHKEELT